MTISLKKISNAIGVMYRLKHIYQEAVLSLLLLPRLARAPLDSGTIS